MKHLSIFTKFMMLYVGVVILSFWANMHARNEEETAVHHQVIADVLAEKAKKLNQADSQKPTDAQHAEGNNVVVNEAPKDGPGFAIAMGFCTLVILGLGVSCGVLYKLLKNEQGHVQSAQQQLNEADRRRLAAEQQAGDAVRQRQDEFMQHMDADHQRHDEFMRRITAEQRADDAEQRVRHAQGQIHDLGFQLNAMTRERDEIQTAAHSFERREEQIHQYWEEATRHWGEARQRAEHLQGTLDQIEEFQPLRDSISVLGFDPNGGGKAVEPSLQLFEDRYNLLKQLPGLPETMVHQFDVAIGCLREKFHEHDAREHDAREHGAGEHNASAHDA